MATTAPNIQINISKNGTTTLATAGKYCETNVDVNVNVPVPSGYIKPTGSKTITENGTHDVTQYANAVVNVAGKPTQFTNLYDPANVVLKKVSNCSGGTVSFASDNYVNYVVIPFHHKANEKVEIRTRGLSMPVRDRQNFTVFGSDGTTPVSWGQLSSACTVYYDEYGDGVLTFKNAAYKTNEWYYLHLNFQYEGINGGASTAYTGPIITINEPIGNGGYAG
jgi:hypothetical protein